MSPIRLQMSPIRLQMSPIRLQMPPIRLQMSLVLKLQHYYYYYHHFIIVCYYYYCYYYYYIIIFIIIISCIGIFYCCKCDFVGGFLMSVVSSFLVALGNRGSPHEVILIVVRVPGSQSTLLYIIYIVLLMVALCEQIYISFHFISLPS